MRPKAGLSSCHPAHRGASVRKTSRATERDAAPAGEVRHLRARAAPGLRLGALRPPARSWLIAVSFTSPRKARPGAEKNRNGAPAGVSSPIARGGGDDREASHGRFRTPPGTRSQGSRAFRRSAPLTFAGAREFGLPAAPAPLSNPGDDACPHASCLTIEYREIVDPVGRISEA